MHMDALVYLIDNDQAMLESLTWLIESADLKLKIYKCPKKFLVEYDKNQHGCLILNLRMPSLSGIEVQQQLANMGSNLPVIFIAGYAEVSIVVQAMRNGAIDFLIKPFHDKVLLDSVSRALLTDKNSRDMQKLNVERREKIALLSQREKQVLQGILASEQNKLISARLNISLKTVEAHRSSMMRKLNVTSVVDLVRLVVSHESQINA